MGEIEIQTMLMDMNQRLTRIETLLTDDNGLMSRVKSIEDNPEKLKNFWGNAIIALISAIIGSASFNFAITLIKK